MVTLVHMGVKLCTCTKQKRLNGICQDIRPHCTYTITVFTISDIRNAGLSTFMMT
jgi:hypothetical protein